MAAPDVLRRCAAPLSSCRIRGFTLVELVVTLVLLSIVAVAVLNALAFSVRHQSDALWQARAVALGESYLEEILGRRYDASTPIGGVPPCTVATTPCSDVATLGADPADRALFETVSDYHGLVDAPPRDTEGNPRGGYDSFQVEVAVRYATADEQAALGLDAPTDAKHIEVRVTDRGEQTLVFSAWRGNF